MTDGELAHMPQGFVCRGLCIWYPAAFSLHCGIPKLCPLPATPTPSNCASCTEQSLGGKGSPAVQY
eukprot:358486-Chlamydomonas_euryale.AAC.7